MKEAFPHLLAPLKVGPLTLKNRIVSAPTSVPHLNEDGTINPEVIAYYAEKAKGGCAVVTVGESIVRIRDGKSHPRQIPLDNPEVVTGLTQLADAIHAHGAYASIELSHGGGLCPPDFIPGQQAIGPSDIIKDKEGTCGHPSAFYSKIHGLTEGEIADIVAAFGRAAALVKSCGFDMCMIHGGHGWLLHQFLSPLTNHRTDRFGGSLENRARFALMVINSVRQATGPNFPIEFRMSGSERTEGGFDLKTGLAFAKLIDGKVDLIHVSAGTQEVEYSEVLMHPSIFQRHGENVRYAATIKKYVTTPVVTVGALSEPDKMEAILASGQADVLALGRQLMADPNLPAKLARGQAEDVVPCLRCHECMGSMMSTRTIRCTVNPVIGRELWEGLRSPAKSSRKVLVAGGGPGGMAAAIYAARRGHRVTLCEASDRLGGALSFAEGVGFKRNILLYKAWLERTLAREAVEVRLNTAVTRDLVCREAPDALFLCVGSDPIVPPIPGVEGKNVILGKCLTSATPLGHRVVIIGGGLVGCETGVHLAMDGRQVTVVEMAPEVATDCGHFHRVALMEELERVTLRTSCRCVSISSAGVTIQTAEGREALIPADHVVLAVGMRPRTQIVDQLRGLVPNTVVIGDCNRPGKILTAVRNGYDAAMDL